MTILAILAGIILGAAGYSFGRSGTQGRYRSTKVVTMDILTILAILITVHACGGLGFAWVAWEYWANLV